MKKFIKNITIVLLAMSSLKSVGGEIQHQNEILRSAPSAMITVGDPSAVKQVEESIPVAGMADYDVLNVISLNLDHSSMEFFNAPHTIGVVLNVERWDANGDPMLNETATLEINTDSRYNRETTDRSMLKLSGGYKIRMTLTAVTIDGVTNGTPAQLPLNVYVEEEIRMRRYFEYTGATAAITGITALNTDCDPVGQKDELQVNWGVVTGAEEYQMEWTYVNDYGFDPAGTTTISPSSLYADFKNNATRVTTRGAEQSYRITLAYERGYIAFRVRAVGRDYLHPEKYIYGTWSSPEHVTISSINPLAVYYNASAHEHSKNWQYSSTFAEEGKKKEVISYFDGSLHNRQSVTKVNTEKNVIVGETIYDFQGRPAVNVLPTPVSFDACGDPLTSEPALKFYSKYNVSHAGDSYSKLNFDLDGSGSCNASAEAMDKSKGSSNYYSEDNTHKDGFQAFVPDAQEFPFSQIEYTPDNTGRIRAQSGVGTTFKLGSGHETKYIYSQPNQIQLDRLFGSEAGSFSHYKKNTVIDANGQISVSYLNQEGKVVATSLAGNPPTDKVTGTVFMEPISSALENAKDFTVDAFGKDANGKSTSNTITPLQDAITFSTQLSVSYNSTYTFNYDLSIDTLQDNCLRNDYCISCIYDLEIKVQDECGVDITSLGTADNQPVKKRVGHLEPAPNGFTMNCGSPHGSADAEAITLNLLPGVYTVSKTLSVNAEARDFYLQKYLDSTYNSCIKTKYDFVHEALLHVDTSGCHISCDACAAALGTKDDFVASGKGTEFQYDFLLEECMAPCRDKTLCESSYEMMLIDVGPGGQYGKYNEATMSAAGMNLSVFNESNELPATKGTVQVTGTPPYGFPPFTYTYPYGSWRKPLLILGGHPYGVYLDENGERVKVKVVPAATPNGWDPEVHVTADIHTDPISGDKYIYPENLEHLADFIPMWKDYFARSLVIYHPEYAYYVACTDQSRKMAGDAMSTDQVDSLMMETETFDDAVLNGFIKPAYASITDPNQRIVDLFDPSPSHLSDPFFANPAAFNEFFGPFASPYLLSSSYPFSQGALVAVMSQRMNNYINPSPGTSFSMVEAAAMAARCGNTFSSASSAASCKDFGGTIVGATPAEITAVRNAEWQNFKNFYISEKRKLEFRRMNHFALHLAFATGGMPTTEIMGGCNACIGNSSFNPFTMGFFSPFSIFGFTSPAYDRSQPCSFYGHPAIRNLTKRFSDPENTGLSTANTPYAVYQQTGECPLGFELLNFLNTLAQGQYLYPAATVPLNTVSAFGPNLYTAVSGGTAPATYINYNWNVTSASGGILTADITAPSASVPACTVTLDITGTAIPDFTRIVSLQNLSYQGTSGGVDEFNLWATYLLSATGTTTATVKIKGSSQIKIHGCQFEASCEANQLALDLMNLSNMMKMNGLENSTTNMSLDPSIEPAVTASIKTMLGTPNSNVTWEFASPGIIKIYDNANPGTQLVLTTLSATPASALANVVSYANIRSNYNNLYKMDGMDINGNKIVDYEGKAEKITGTVVTPVSMGKCGLPPSPDCNSTEHLVRNDLEALLDEVIKGSVDGSIDLYTKMNFSSLLQNYFSSTLTSTTSAYAETLTTDGDPLSDTVTINTEGSCNIELHHKDYATDDQPLYLTDLVSVSGLTGTGSVDAQQNFHDFYFIGVFNVDGELVSDTVFGSSCLPLKNCELCPGTSVAVGRECFGMNTGLMEKEYYEIAYIIQNYNASGYALAHNHTITLENISLYFIQNNSDPECLSDYLQTLTLYANAPSDTIAPLPVFSCGLQVLDKCDSAYMAYVDAVFHYNTVTAQDFNYSRPQIPYILSQQCFKDHYCNCATHFIANLEAIDHGYPLKADLKGDDNSYASYSQLQLTMACPPVTKTCDTVPVATEFPPATWSPDPCVVQALAAATQNALNQYNQYIDSTFTSLVTRYNEHCLHPVENLKYTYKDKEYHFTLYYYDQAGNLVKTIPPEGVEPLNITKDTDPLEAQVNQDRTANTHTVFTSHRMATTYEYNSLNQLVRQDMPDHEKMDICQSILPNGLDNDLTITNVQFINSSRGVLTGYLTRTIGTATIQRGYVYTTSNGGQNWLPVTGLAAGDIRKVQMVNSTTGYAVANYGLVFKTLDGGASWDVITTLYNTPQQYFGDLNDLYFTGPLDGIVGGIKGSSSGGVYKTTDGGATWSATGGFALNDTITGLTWDGTNYFASVNNKRGKIYIGTSGGTTWTEQTGYTANDLKKVQYISNDTAYAVGNDGTLLRYNAADNAWTLLPTNTPYKFADVYFKNGWQGHGVALAEVVPGKYGIYKTFDGGKSWTLMSAAGKYFSSLQVYDKVHGKAIAAGENGTVTKVLLSAPPFNLSDVSYNLATATPPDNLGYAHAVSGTGVLASIAVSENSTNVYFKYNIDNSSNWETFAVTASGLSGFKKALLSETGTTPETRGILLGTDGIIYQFYRTYNATTVTLTPVTTSANHFSDIAARNDSPDGKFYAYDNTSGTMYSIVYSGTTGSVVTAAAMAGAPAAITAVINSLAVSDGGNNIMLAGDAGALVHSSLFTPSSVSWTDQSEKVIPLPLNDITASGTNLTAVGNDGTEWYSVNGGSNWRLAENGTGVKLNAVRLQNATPATGVIVGDEGNLYTVADGISAAPGLTALTSVTTANLNDVTIEEAGIRAYAVAEDGKTIFVDDYTNALAEPKVSLAGNVNGSLKGISMIPSETDAIAVGDKAAVLMFAESNGSLINEVFTGPLNGAHFFDANNGYVADNGKVLRRTTNGGNTWKVVLPQASLPAVSKVYATAANKALIIGANHYVAQITNESVPVSISNTVASDFKDINFNSTGYGVIVGSNGQAASISASGSTYAVNAIGQAGGGGFDFNAVHVFNNVANTNEKHFIAAGTNGNVYYHTSPTGTGGTYVSQGSNITAGATLKDIYFHDDRTGYVVGSSGEAYKCVLEANIDQAVAAGTTAVQWHALCTGAIYSGRTGTDVSFNAIAFSTRVNGFLGGSYAATGNHLHAVLMSDESFLYSTRFWYDKLGRMVLSQNTKQFAKTPQAYSYTLYDELGRIKEVGEKAENAALKQPSVFGTEINHFYNTKMIDDAKFLAWINTTNGARTEVTKTYYDNTVITGLPIAQDNLRKRVASVTYEDVFDGNDQTYQHATHYSYDIHGNVKTLLQDNKKQYDAALALTSPLVNQRFKRIDYEYDLISGKVNTVRYQDGQPDAFYHFYDYDGDNRLKAVYTSQYPQTATITCNTVTDNPLWDREAKYFYYAHGPLARVEYGNEKVQGVDYAYTLQGWIKGVNSNTLDESRDMGQDGKTGGVYSSTNADIHKSVAKDAYGYSLNYFADDYKAISGLRWSNVTDRFEAVTAGSEMEAARYDLFNGNISSMVTTIEKLDSTAAGIAKAPIVQPLGTAYKYDQLNRLKSSVAFDKVNLANDNKWETSGSTAQMYKNTFAYDANGNILSQNRSDEHGNEFDHLQYQYKKDGNGNMLQNRLYHVNDNVTASAPTDDIEDEGTFTGTQSLINFKNNYSYDKIGNLTKDSSEQISNIQWTVYGKIKSITRYSSSTKDNLTFDYDAGGNRVAKHVYDAGNNWKYSTYYVRDAQGNVMSVYDHKAIVPASGPVTFSYKLIEQDIFGSTRIGLNLPEKEMIDAITPDVLSHILGKKRFELSNHLNNVLTTVSDRKISIDENNDGMIDYFLSDVINAGDYSAFGVKLYKRGFDFKGYRYSFNGQEKDDEIKGEENVLSFKYRMEDARLARFFAVDPLARKYPFYSPYQFAGNSPIEAKELEGLEPSHTAVKSDCEDCDEATLKDGDYLSDVQDQKYTTTFSGVDNKTFEEVKSKFSTDPGSIINNDRAKYRLVDRDGSYGVTPGDHFDIDIKGSPNGFVVVKSVIVQQNSITVQVQTLEGHPDAGTNTFSLSYDPKTGTVVWETHNISRTNDNFLGGLGAGVASARSKQQAQWQDVAVKVFQALGSPNVSSATANVKEYDYNDWSNQIGKEEADESFNKSFIDEFKTP